MRTNEENGIKDEAIMIVIEWEEEDRGGGGAALRMRTYEENGVAHEAIVIEWAVSSAFGVASVHCSV